jgi:uncharacterized protein
MPDMKLSWLIPQEKKFYELLEQYAELACKCASQMLDLFENFDRRKEKWREVKATEERGDDMLHCIVEELNKTFVTPIDREDIYSLAGKMDDILDFAEGAAERVILFKIKQTPPRLLEMAEVLYEASKELSIAMQLMKTPTRWEEMKKHLVEIHRLENRGDELLRIAISELFDTTDAVEIIKLKEIYECVEEAVDHCEDVAVVLQNLIVKQG